MAKLPIVIYPDKRLEKQSESVGYGGKELDQLIRDMGETMYAAGGAGLAAVQVGAMKRLFVVESEIAGLKPEDPPLAFVDPEIVEFSKEKEVGEEGCLSLPGVYVPVERSVRVKARAKDAQGKAFEVEAEGLFARVIQHETDHLNGKIILDYVGKLKRASLLRTMQRELKKREENEDEE